MTARVRCSARNLSHQHGMCEGWRIAVTGHSLGAGIAAFVAMHLRRRYCRVQGWCFSPPGWLMTPELANKTRSFITSVVVNKDLIPRCVHLPACAQAGPSYTLQRVRAQVCNCRLTLRSLEHLRDDLVYAGVRCKYSKARVVTGTVCGGGCCWARRRKSWAKLEAMFNPESCGATDGARDFLSSCAPVLQCTRNEVVAVKILKAEVQCCWSFRTTVPSRGATLHLAHRYRRSVAEHVTDREFDTLQSFRLPGNVLFMRCLKTKRKQPCVPAAFATAKYNAFLLPADHPCVWTSVSCVRNFHSSHVQH